MPKNRLRKHWGNIGLAALGAVTVGAVALMTIDTSAEPEAVSPQVQKYYDENVTAKPLASTGQQQAIRFAAYGDSITEGDSPDFGAGRFGSLSWTSYLGDGITFAGGWSDGGVKTSAMLENAQPVSADVLVLIAGTNDYANNVPFSETAANFQGIAQKSQVGRVIVSAVPPHDEVPELSAAFNANLEELATAQGWEFIDAPAGVRAGNVYADGMTKDGVHPTAEAARILGEAIRAAILAG